MELIGIKIGGEVRKIKELYWHFELDFQLQDDSRRWVLEGGEFNHVINLYAAQVRMGSWGIRYTHLNRKLFSSPGPVRRVVVRAS